MKIYIEDLVNKMEGRPEKQLPVSTTIRVELESGEFRVSISDGKLSILKTAHNATRLVNNTHHEQISVLPNSSNKITIE